MKVGPFAAPLKHSLVVALAFMGFCPPAALAQHDQHDQPSLMSQHRPPTAEQKNQASAFVDVVRDATRRFGDVSVAIAEGYVLQFGCVSGSDVGAMGVHFVNGALVGDPALDPTKPELLVYEPQPNGRMKLVAADFLVLKDSWDASHDGPPELMGQLFHLFDSPNRFGLPAFYTLHVWAWRENPNGTFTNWNPKVSCDWFNGEDK